MKFGICYCYWNKNWEGEDYPVFIERARRCGFDGLEIFYGRLFEMGQKEADEIVAACKANDVEMYISGGYGRDMDVSELDEDVRKHAVAKSIELCKAMNRIGAHNFSGINYGAWCAFDNANNKPKMFEQSAKSLKEIGKVAQDLDISWNMEVINRFENCLLNTAVEGRKLADMVDMPSVNILLDTFHGMIEEDDMCEAIRTAGDKLGHYHMGTNNRRPPAPCILPWQDICNTLSEIGYDRCISFEPLVHTGGTVAMSGGNVWRPMLPLDADDAKQDQIITESLNYIKGMFKK